MSSRPVHIIETGSEIFPAIEEISPHWHQLFLESLSFTEEKIRKIRSTK